VFVDLQIKHSTVANTYNSR